MSYSISRRALIAGMVAAPIAGAIGLDSSEPAPHFHAKSMDGDNYDNESLKGKNVLIQFWTTWCPYCRNDEPAFEAVIQDFADKGLVVLAVNVGESKKKVKKYLEQSPRPCKVVLTEDTNLAAFFAANAYPIYVLIDKDGNVAGTQRGAGGEGALRRLLKKVGLEAE